jgi:D-beta-D-heptose 7-phosphate kinase/D-beta-D-heptose 1-phosphate adenosyltransferase
LNSDQSVSRLKGPSRPYNLKEDRKYLLESLKFVDEVVVFEQDTPLDLIKHVRPDIIVKGGDYLPHEVIGSNLVEVRIFNTIHGYSTTKTIQDISSRG